MQKRTKLAIVILIGLLLLILGLYLLLSPYLAARNVATPEPTSDIPYVAGPKIAIPTSTSTPVAPVPEKTLQLRALQDRAKATVERIGSGSSESGFLGAIDALSGTTPDGAAQIRADLDALQKAHPASGPAFGITTRAVASRVEQGVIGDATIVISVDAIQYEDAGIPSKPTKTQAKQVKITFRSVAPIDSGYLIDQIEWTDISL